MRLQIRKTDESITNREWLELATDENREPLANIHGNFSSDGVMIFVVDNNQVCKCDHEEAHNKIADNVDRFKNSKFQFSIDAERLIQAISIISEDDNIIRFFFDGDKSALVIQGNTSYYTAIVMPLDPQSVSQKLEIPQPRFESKTDETPLLTSG